MFRFKLHPFYEMDGAIGGSPSVEGAAEAASAETASVQETPNAEVSTESESSFAKRLREHSEKAIRAEREKWENETGEKYKDYDLLKTTAEFFRERHGFQDLLSMKEEIELEQLQARADKEQVSPEVLRRIDELEARAAEGEQIKQQVADEQRVNHYRSALDEFVKDKGVESDALNQFMIDNQLTYDPENMDKSFNIALRAMKAEDYEKQANAREEEVINKYLASKQAPKVEGSVGAAGTQSADTSKMSWKDLTRHAAGRIEASKTAQ